MRSLYGVGRAQGRRPWTRNVWLLAPLAAAAALAASLLAPPALTRVQNKNQKGPGSAATQDLGGGKSDGLPLRLGRTKLEVAFTLGGDFEQWVKEFKITSAYQLAFRWSTTETGVTSAVWEVTSMPGGFPPHTSPVAPALHAHGELPQVPAPGQMRTFFVDFTQFAPATPPASPKQYYVRVVPRRGQQRLRPSGEVRITYAQPGPQTDFSGIPDQTPPPLPIYIGLKKLKIEDADEDADEPYLYVVAFYADGTTIHPANLGSATVRLDSPARTHENLVQGDRDEWPQGFSISIPISTGLLKNSIKPLPGGLPTKLATGLSQVGILVVALEEDATTDAAAEAGRKALVENLQRELDAAVRAVAKPDIEAIQSRVSAAVVEAVKEETLKDWWAPWGLFDAFDPDDFIGAGFQVFTYADLQSGGPKNFHFDFQNGEAHYVITGTAGRDY